MIRLELSSEEQQVLLEALATDISDLSMEISRTSRTESHDYREDLKARKQTLARIAEALH